jgi:hypothetical protein
MLMTMQYPVLVKRKLTMGLSNFKKCVLDSISCLCGMGKKIGGRELSEEWSRMLFLRFKLVAALRSAF